MCVQATRAPLGAALSIDQQLVYNGQQRKHGRETVDRSSFVLDCMRYAPQVSCHIHDRRRLAQILSCMHMPPIISQPTTALAPLAGMTRITVASRAGNIYELRLASNQHVCSSCTQATSCPTVMRAETTFTIRRNQQATIREPTHVCA